MLAYILVPARLFTTRVATSASYSRGSIRAAAVIGTSAGAASSYINRNEGTDLDYIGEIISGVFALLVVWLEVRMTRDRKQAEKRAIIRAKESKLAMKMQDASLSLSLATAIAVERGETNGEMKTAREKAKTAQEEYEDFVHELASEQATSI